MISTTDFFYLSLGMGFLVLVACAVAISIQVYKILADVRIVTGNAVDAVSDVVSVKENLKLVMTTLVGKLIDKIGDRKGGETKKENGD
jgi:hypothetical protein